MTCMCVSWQVEASPAGVLSGANVCRIAVQLIDVLQAIHAKGLVYCDVKPENFMLR